MSTTDTIINGLLELARKYELDSEYDSNDVFIFKGVPLGMGQTIEDDVGMLLLKHGQNSSIGYHPASGALRVAWENNSKED